MQAIALYSPRPIRRTISNPCCTQLAHDPVFPLTIKPRLTDAAAIIIIIISSICPMPAMAPDSGQRVEKVLWNLSAFRLHNL